MTPWWELPLLGFDTETSGVDVEIDRIVTASLVLVESDGTVTESHDWLINPGVPIPVQATAVHGVTNEHAQKAGASAREGIADLVATLRRLHTDHPIVGFNVSFDLTLLDREARRHGYQPLAPSPVIDPFVLDKQADRYRRGKRTLAACATHYGVTLDAAHAADADALAAVQVARAIGRQHQPPADPHQLHVGQIQWRAQQCASLEDYLRRTTDQHAVIDGTWPVHPFKQQENVA